MVEREAHDRDLAAAQGLHEGHDLRIVANRREDAVDFSSLLLPRDPVQDGQLPVVLPRVSRDAGKPWMVGRRNQRKYIASCHGMDCTIVDGDTIV